MIFDMYAREKIGCATIAQRLNALGLRTNTDHLWTNSSVMCISKNPVYAGYVTWGKRTSVTRMNADGTLSTSRVANAASILAPGKHPALIDQATFDAAPKCPRFARPHALSCQRAGSQPTRRIGLLRRLWQGDGAQG